MEPCFDIAHLAHVEMYTDKVTEAPANNGIEMDLDDSIYLGDRWEYRLRRGDFVAKAHGTVQMPTGKVWAQIPPESVWLFSGAQK